MSSICRFIFCTHDNVIDLFGVRCVKMSTDKISNQRALFSVELWSQTIHDTAHINLIKTVYFFHFFFILISPISRLTFIAVSRISRNKYWRVKLDGDDEKRKLCNFSWSVSILIPFVLIKKSHRKFGFINIDWFWFSYSTVSTLVTHFSPSCSICCLFEWKAERIFVYNIKFAVSEFQSTFSE